MSAINTVGAFTLLGLWTLGPPIAIQQAADGKFEISVGASAGKYVAAKQSCSGDLLSSETGSARTGAAMVEYRNGRLRLSGFGGAVSASDLFEGGDGAFGGGMIAYEGDAVGVGTGVTFLPWAHAASSRQRVASGYLRVGAQDAFHFHADLYAPSPLFGSTGLARMGVGVPIGASRALFGAGWGRPVDSEQSNVTQAGVFAELNIATGERWRLLLSGSAFSGHEDQTDPDWAVGAGFSFRPR